MNKSKTPVKIGGRGFESQNQSLLSSNNDLCKIGSNTMNSSELSMKYRDERAPILFLDVNLGKGKIQRLVINQGDKPEQVAEDFVHTYGTTFYLFTLIQVWIKTKSKS